MEDSTHVSFGAQLTGTSATLAENVLCGLDGNGNAKCTQIESQNFGSSKEVKTETTSGKAEVTAVPINSIAEGVGSSSGTRKATVTGLSLLFGVVAGVAVGF